MRTKRQGLIIWFQHMKNIKQIKRFGHLIYVSRRLKYAVIYVEQTKVEEVETKLLKYSFVSKIDRSYKSEIRTNFDNAKPDKAKEYDYKMGI
ncbi:YlbG family protein [Ornithinibacillus halophilus]|uniref:UPF0298 protein SAMN05216225_100132 n=1 Tax=Ornithinibacillus halophilus TaxID=930117 RepID=A0A1M5C2J6_9BACI|nr:DUF2129 domain-containing protein [Ornithinibacillus halophilus]SHF48993.1 Uncharacterized protein YlbG, UPF0298 family [Ornithinibacillus halophilus]